MIPIFKTLYSLVLIISFTIAIAFSYCRFQLRRDTKSIALMGLFIVYVFDIIVIYMTEQLPGFASWYDTTFLSVPTIKTIVYLASAACLFLLWNSLFHKPFAPWQGIVLIVMGLWYMFIPMLENGAFKVWLYYIVYQVFTLLLSGSVLYFGKNNADINRKMKILMILTVVFSVLISLEDAAVIFHMDSFHVGRIDIQDRNYCEDILRLCYTAATIHVFLNEMKVTIAQRNEQPNLTQSTPPEPAGFAQHAKDYKRLKYVQTIALTEREREVFHLLIQDKNNNEICEELCISIGTVKAHVHNIFQKANVATRRELIGQYEMFFADELANKSGTITQ